MREGAPGRATEKVGGNEGTRERGMEAMRKHDWEEKGGHGLPPSLPPSLPASLPPFLPSTSFLLLLLLLLLLRTPAFAASGIAAWPPPIRQGRENGEGGKEGWVWAHGALAVAAAAAAAAAVGVADAVPLFLLLFRYLPFLVDVVAPGDGSWRARRRRRRSISQMQENLWERWQQQ